MPEPSQILIVDDNPRMVALIERWLVRAGYHVTGVTTVSEALGALTAHAIAWVITDLMLPTGDGMDILAYARTHLPQAKVIIMTAFGSEAMRRRALAHGAHAFLSKPFSGEALLAMLTQDPAPERSPWRQAAISKLLKLSSGSGQAIVRPSNGVSPERGGPADSPPEPHLPVGERPPDSRPVH